jgi:hypothetical protein
MDVQLEHAGLTKTEEGTYRVKFQVACILPLTVWNEFQERAILINNQVMPLQSPI